MDLPIENPEETQPFPWFEKSHAVLPVNGLSKQTDLSVFLSALDTFGR
jgi:hypothetical protein